MSSARGSLCCSLPFPLSSVDAMGVGDQERDWRHEGGLGILMESPFSSKKVGGGMMGPCISKAAVLYQS